MLVLSRKVGEEILVPDCNLTIQVVAVRGKTVRVGISAPPEVTILWAAIAAARDNPSPPGERRA
jgi:carbon storage regulator CsrA